MKKLSPGIRFLLGFITFLLCVVLFVTTIAGILVSNVVNILSSQENVESLLRQVMFVDMKHPVSVHNAPRGNAPAVRQAPVRTLAPSDIRLSEQETAVSMVEWIYGELTKDFGDDLQIPLEEVQGFVERSTLDDFLVEKGAGLVNDVFTGESTVTLTPEEIEANIVENTPLIEEVFNITVDPEVIANITAVIEENEYISRLEEEGILNVLLNPNGASNPQQNPNLAKTNQLITTIRTFLSTGAVLIFTFVCLALIGLILLINMKQVWSGMNASGIALMLAALPSVVFTIIVWAAPGGWAAQLGLFSILEVLIRQIVTMNAGICISLFVLGLLLLIGGIIIKGAARRKYENAEIEANLAAKIDFSDSL